MVGFEWGKQDLSVDGKGNHQQQQHAPHNNGSSGHNQPKVGNVLITMLDAFDLPNSITCKVEHCCLCTNSLASTTESQTRQACRQIMQFGVDPEQLYADGRSYDTETVIADCDISACSSVNLASQGPSPAHPRSQKPNLSDCTEPDVCSRHTPQMGLQRMAGCPQSSGRGKK